MKISDMFLGKIDANNEKGLLSEDDFEGLFEDIPGCSVQRLLNGSAAFVLGNKGTGKTMLLRYAELKARREAHPTCFIRYKRDIGERDQAILRQSASPARNVDNEIDVYEGPIQNTKLNYTLAWKLYLIRVIVDLIRSDAEEVVDKDDTNWKTLCRLLDSVYLDSDSKPINTILPKISKGQIRLMSKHAEFTFDCESCRDDTLQAPFIDVAEQIVDCYKALIPLPCEHPLYVFIDELELHYSFKKEYERELRMIGSLVSAVDSLNSISKDKSMQIFIVMALRNEVHRATVNLGAEINKPIEDFGMQLNWRTREADENQPLLNLIQTRVGHNYEQNGLVPPNVWSELFPEEVEGVKTKAYIMRQTWYKPRDVVRYLNALQAVCGNEKKFSYKAFIDVRKEYSRQAWQEIQEELTAAYKQEQIDAIHMVLNGIKCPFSLNDLERKIEEEAAHYGKVEKLMNEMKTAELISVLFHAGIIGNVSDATRDTGRARFAAWEEEKPDLSGKFTVHYPLRFLFDVRS